MTKKGYWMAMVDVRDPYVYRKYIETNGMAFAKYGAKFLVRAGRNTDPEGPTGNRHVIIEFETYETALACYNSPEYQEALKHRLAGSVGKVVIVEGV